MAGPLFGGEPLAWIAKRLGALLSPILDLLYTTKLHLMTESVLPPSMGSMSGYHNNENMFCFNIHFVVLVSELNSK